MAGTHVDPESLQEFSRKVYGFAGDLAHSRAYGTSAATAANGVIGQYGYHLTGQAPIYEGGGTIPALPEAVEFWKNHAKMVNLLNNFKNKVEMSVQAISAAAGAAAGLYDHTDRVSGKQIMNSAFVPQPGQGQHAPKGTLQHLWDLQQKKHGGQG
ncbi:hypothetical protein [Amycolatopsis taiwanensis]|uniref:Uncharacterized protein n=1 Tax=Amycolatopsis taiwanensis TaxID=342230 RepID=A0A9W6QZ60_9PSEU|nr:hypothetical protein [Amycolatopsis taiwanensis]GLY64727.1 hypothetical protein Atai01_13460 [Amycolatopsis taiwanensis]